ncbi:nucleoside hydrolase [Herbiconiux moechotypicola]|uniref:Nucleoside hydrolase n=1 Tax=Herbiconiux moechotypicola TaxID=637393 RepID=A0ABN3DE89_9MICO
MDTDPGIDDAMALLYLAGRDDVELRAVTSVYGNTDVDSALLNIARVLDLAGLGETPTARGASGPLEGTAELAAPVHGIDGLGGLWPEPARPLRLSELSSAELIVEIGRAEPRQHHLFALGPLTNLGLALQLDPLILTRYRSVMVMGGSGPFGPPGSELTADSNVSNDPVAARAVFAAPRVSMLSVGVNVTIQAILDEGFWADLRSSGSAWSHFSATVLQQYNDFYRHTWGRRISPAHDGFAVALALEPGWIRAVERGPVNVLSDGYGARARLMRLPDGSLPAFEIEPVPDTDVVVEGDKAAFVADLMRILRRGRSR